MAQRKGTGKTRSLAAKKSATSGRKSGMATKGSDRKKKPAAKTVKQPSRSATAAAKPSKSATGARAKAPAPAPQAPAATTHVWPGLPPNYFKH